MFACLYVRVNAALGDAAVHTAACGSCHTAVVTEEGFLWTFGRGVCGALGHGDDHNQWEPCLVRAKTTPTAQHTNQKQSRHLCTHARLRTQIVSDTHVAFSLTPTQSRPHCQTRSRAHAQADTYASLRSRTRCARTRGFRLVTVSWGRSQWLLYPAVRLTPLLWRRGATCGCGEGENMECLG